MVEGQEVRLAYDQQRKDKHGRTLAYVYLADGTFLNAKIIRQGYGFAYTRFPFKHLEEFRRLGGAGGEAGLWAR
jgi:micrococcal nuclease